MFLDWSSPWKILEKLVLSFMHLPWKIDLSELSMLLIQLCNTIHHTLIDMFVLYTIFDEVSINWLVENSFSLNSFVETI